MENNEAIINNLLVFGSKLLSLSTTDDNGENISIGKLIRFIKGKKPHSIGKIKLPYISMDGATSGKYTFEYAVGMVLCDEYDVLMVMDGASSGKVFTGQSGIVSSTFAKLQIEPAYQEIVYWFLLSKQDIIGQQNTGSAIPHANKQFVNSLILHMPTNDEVQNQLRAIRSKIFALRAENAKLVTLKHEYLKRFFS